MATFTQNLSNDSRYSITFEVYETSYSIPNNTSDAHYKLTATKSSGTGYWSSSAVSPVQVFINGVKIEDKLVTYDFRGSTPKTITLAEGDVTGIEHNSDGTKTIAVSGYFSDGANNRGNATASGDVTLTTIPRKTSITNFTVAKRNETSLTFNWATADTIDYLWYSTNNGSSWTGYDVTDGTSGNFVVSGLSANTTYNCKIRVRRKDSQLPTDSSTVSQTTNAYPQFTTQPTYSDRTETTIDVYYKPNMTVGSAQYRIKTTSGSYSSWTNINSSNVISGNATTIAGCTFRISSLTPNTNYVVQVRLKSTLTDNYTNSNEVSTNMYTYAYPYCTEAPNFTIGEDVTIKLYNPLNRSVQIQMWSYKSQGFVSDLITISGTSYKGFSNVANRLYASIPNDTASQYTIDVHCGSNKATKAGGNYTINYETSIPTFNDFTYSTNLSELTGNNDTIINGETSTTFTISTTNKATSNYGASITKYRVECGTQQQEVAYSSTEEVSYTLPNCNNQVIKVTAVDSRGLEKSISKTVTNFKNYSKPTFRNITTERNDGVEATTKLNFAVAYWNESFGDATNTITYVAYRSKLTTASDYGSYTLIPVSNLTISGGYATLTNYLIHANGSSGGYETGEAYNVEVMIRDGKSTYMLETIYAYSNITDGNVAFSTLQDNNGKYHMGINGMPDLNHTAVIHGNAKLEGQLHMNPNADIYWKENSYGDKFDIVPTFSGYDDSNKLLIRGAVGGAGTDPSLYDLMSISGKSGHVEIKGNITTGGKCIIPNGDGKGLYNSTNYPIIRDFNNNNVSVDATGGTLYLGYQNTTSINILNGKSTIDANGNYSGKASNVTQKKSLSSTSHSNFGTNNGYVPDMSFIAYWNGAYNSSNASNLAYCKNGEIASITSGTNYTKMSDGTLICYGTFTVPAISGSSGSFTSVNFSSTFVDTSYRASFTPSAGGNYWSWIAVKVQTKRTSGMDIEYYNNASGGTSVAVTFDYIIIGKWK